MAWDCGVPDWGTWEVSSCDGNCRGFTHASRRCYCQGKVPYNSGEGMRVRVAVGKKHHPDFRALI